MFINPVSTNMLNEIKYQAIWGKLYILLGVLFGLLFVFGAFLLKDYTILLNLAATFIVIYLGYSMLNRPNIKYNDKEIMVMGFMGSIRKHYRFESKSEITIRNNRLYQGGKKLRMNNWMVDKKDWNRMIAFFSDEGEVIMEELVDGY